MNKYKKSKKEINEEYQVSEADKFKEFKVVFLKWKTDMLQTTVLVRNSRGGFLTTEQLPMKKMLITLSQDVFLICLQTKNTCCFFYQCFIIYEL